MDKGTHSYGERSHLPLAKKSALGLLFSIMLMDVTGITILYPVSAYIVRQYSSQALMVILLTVIYAAAQFFAAPLLGKLSDHYGRRPVLLISLLGSAVGYLVFGFGGALWVLYLSRLIAGITGGNMSAATAYIVDVSRTEELAKNLTLVGLAWGFGLILGPALGGFLGQITLRAPAFVSALFALVNMSLGFFWLPESLPVERREKGRLHPSDYNPFVAIRAIGLIPGLGILLVVQCLFNFAFNSMNSTETLFIILRFNAQPAQIGLLQVLVGAGIATVQLGLLPRLVPRFGERLSAFTCLLMQSIGALAVSFNPVFGLVYPIIVLRSGASAFIFPTLGALSARRVTASQQGALAGVSTALNSLMTIFAPLLAGVLYDHWSPGAPYWTAALLFTIAAYSLSRIHHAVGQVNPAAG